MNNIHEDDWSDDTWSRHSGMFIPDSGSEKSKEQSDVVDGEELKKTLSSDN